VVAEVETLDNATDRATHPLKAPRSASPERVDEEFEITLPPEASRRLRETLIELAIESGGDSFALADASRGAGLPADQIERSFSTTEAAFAWIYRSSAAELQSVIAAAFECQEVWTDAMRCAGYSAARWFEDNPNVVRAGMVELRGAGEQAEIAREVFIDWAIDLIDTGRGELAEPDSKDRSAAVGAMGASYASLAKAVITRGPDPRPSELVADWMYAAVLPYLGREAAVAELDRRDSDLERFRRGEI
jgi:hypothetical protein